MGASSIAVNLSVSGCWRYFFCLENQKERVTVSSLYRLALKPLTFTLETHRDKDSFVILERALITSDDQMLNVASIQHRSPCFKIGVIVDSLCRKEVQLPGSMLVLLKFLVYGMKEKQQSGL